MEMPMILAKYKLDDTKSVTWQTQDNRSVAQRDCQMCLTFIHASARRWVNLNVYSELLIELTHHSAYRGVPLLRRFSWNCEKRLLASSWVFVRRTECKNSSPTKRGFVKFYYLIIFRKYIEEIQFSIKSDKNNGNCAWRPIYRVSQK